MEYEINGLSFLDSLEGAALSLQGYEDKGSKTGIRTYIGLGEVQFTTDTPLSTPGDISSLASDIRTCWGFVVDTVNLENSLYGQ